MSGRTGKMTREALAARGPRMVLASIQKPGGPELGLIIFREGQIPINREKGYYTLLAKSFTLRYLLMLGKGNLRINHATAVTE